MPVCVIVFLPAGVHDSQLLADVSEVNYPVSPMGSVAALSLCTALKSS